MTIIFVAVEDEGEGTASPIFIKEEDLAEFVQLVDEGDSRYSINDGVASIELPDYLDVDQVINPGRWWRPYTIN